MVGSGSVLLWRCHAFLELPDEAQEKVSGYPNFTAGAICKGVTKPEKINGHFFAEPSALRRKAWGNRPMRLQKIWEKWNSSQKPSSSAMRLWELEHFNLLG
jgi:hypothetical protein